MSSIPAMPERGGIIPMRPVSSTPGAPSRTGWIVAVAALAAILVAVAVIGLVSWNAQRSDISDLEGTVAAQDTSLDELSKDLTASEAVVDEQATELDSLRSGYATASACANRTLRAWTSTINYSYAVTGYRLGNAFMSGDCRDYRELRNSGGVSLFAR